MFAGQKYSEFRHRNIGAHTQNRFWFTLIERVSICVLDRLAELLQVGQLRHSCGNYQLVEGRQVTWRFLRELNLPIQHGNFEII